MSEHPLNALHVRPGADGQRGGRLARLVWLSPSGPTVIAARSKTSRRKFRLRNAAPRTVVKTRSFDAFVATCSARASPGSGGRGLNAAGGSSGAPRERAADLGDRFGHLCRRRVNADPLVPLRVIASSGKSLASRESSRAATIQPGL